MKTTTRRLFMALVGVVTWALLDLITGNVSARSELMIAGLMAMWMAEGA